MLFTASLAEHPREYPFQRCIYTSTKIFYSSHFEGFAPVDTDATTVHRTPGIMPPWLLNKLNHGTPVAQSSARREVS